MAIFWNVLQFQFHVCDILRQSRNIFMHTILWITERGSFPNIEDTLHDTENSFSLVFAENLLKRHLPAVERYFCLGLEVLRITVEAIKSHSM